MKSLKNCGGPKKKFIFLMQKLNYSILFNFVAWTVFVRFTHLAKIVKSIVKFLPFHYITREGCTK